MRKRPLALCAGMIVAGVVAAASNGWADEAPVPQPIVAGGQVAAIKAGTAARATVIASPTLTQTTAVRMRDGSVGMVCEQKRNPAAATRPIRTAAPEPRQ